MSQLEVMYEKQREIPVEFLYKNFEYNPSTGEFFLLPNGFKIFKKTQLLPWPSTKYQKAKIWSKILPVHQIAWAMHYGEWAFSAIDHIDGNPFNNRITNLRLCDAAINARNVKLNKNNKYGLFGLQVFERKGKTSFQMTLKCPEYGTPIIKTFDNLFDAACFRKAFELENGYSERHGKPYEEELSTREFLANVDYSQYKITILEEGEPNFKFEDAYEKITNSDTFYRFISNNIDLPIDF